MSSEIRTELQELLLHHGLDPIFVGEFFFVEIVQKATV
jgi:hypothetical protein